MFEDVISDAKILGERYIDRSGFIFTSLTHPGNIYDAIFIKKVQNERGFFRGFPNSKRTLEEHIQFIKKNNLKKAVILADDLEFLTRVPMSKHLSITIGKDVSRIDYTPLYTMPEVLSLGIGREDFEPLSMPVDYSKIKGLVDVGVSAKEDFNYEKIETLKSLKVSDWRKKDLKALFVSKQLDTLSMIQCGMHSLDGIEQSDCMQCVYLHYNRSLRDINALNRVKKSLKALRIENCPKIEDFSILSELENLELLELTGKNTLPSLNFIRNMKNLKTFTFTMNILDGDLTPCLNLDYVYSAKNRKHYNLKDEDLPKGNYVRGNEDIELWRRME